MRFTPEVLHPIIFERFKEVTARSMSGNPQHNPEETAAVSKHGGVWFAEYWKGAILGLLSYAVPLTASILSRNMFGKGGHNVAVFFILSIFPVLLSIYLYQQNTKVVTLKEIDSLRPALRLNEFESMYLDCFLLVQKSTLLDKSQKIAWSESLKEALDRVIELEALKVEIRDLAMGFSSSDFTTEKKRLEEAIEKASDGVARETYRESLQLLNSRTDKVANAQVQLERIEAQIELSRHTFLRTKETIRSLQIAHKNETVIDLDSLRVNLSGVQNDASEVVKAIQELREM